MLKKGQRQLYKVATSKWLIARKNVALFVSVTCRRVLCGGLRLCGEATKHVVQVLRELGGRSFPVSARAALLPDADDTFLCHPCFRNAEKLLQLFLYFACFAVTY